MERFWTTHNTTGKAVLFPFVILFLTLSLIPAIASAQSKGISFQAVLKRPDGTYPTVSGVAVTLQVLDPVHDCVLREELHSGVNISNGYINLVLGSASASTPGGRNPSPVLTIAQVMENSTPRSGLNCVDTNNNITSSAQTYTPAASHARKLRLRLMIGPDTIVADFNMRSVAFAVNSDMLEGKASADFVQNSANITQARVESVYARYSILDAILSGTYAGNAATATALANTPGACPVGQYMSAMSASGTITCSAPTGSVTNVTSANAYITVATGTSTPVLTAVVGTAANTLAAGNDARFTDSRPPNGTAGGDLSGTYPNPTVAKVAGKSVVLTTPANGDVLTYNGTDFVNLPGADGTKLPLAGGTMTGAIDMNSQNLTNLGYVTMLANKSLHLSNNASDPSGLVAADKGKIWFDSTNAVVKYWNGTAAQTLGVAGSGLQTFNTQTGTSQSLAFTITGTAPGWNSASNVHTLNIPMASAAGVTAGLVSKAEYDALNNKLGTSSTFSGDVSGTYNATSVDKIQGKAITPTTYAAGQTLRYDGTAWVNAVLGFADIGSKPTTLAGYGITDAMSSTLADGKILVGNSSNVATAVTMSGDATLTNAGALTLATVPITKGGTGLTSFAGDKLVTTSAAGALQTSSCAFNEVISFTVGGAITCKSVSALSSSFANGGNSFGADASLGTNDAFALNIKTNNTTKVSILSDGKVGIGQATPTAQLEILQADATGNLPDVLKITGGNSTSSGSGGGITLKAGMSNGIASGGKISLTGGGEPLGAIGGVLTLNGADYAGLGGSALLKGGTGSNGYGGGILTLSGGLGSGSGVGGSIVLGGGVDSGTNANGTDVTILPGAKAGTGTDGNILLAPTRGNVGIGVTAPSVPLEVSGTYTAARFKSVNSNSTVAEFIGVSTPTVAIINSTPSGSTNGPSAIKFRAYDNNPQQVDISGITSVQTSNTVGGHAGYLTLSTTSAGTLAERVRISEAGNVGIGTTSPSAKLQVAGQIVSAPYNNGSATTFNFANGNAQYTSASCGALTLQNMVDGGSYTIAVQGASAGTCTFTDSAGSRTFKFSPANGPTTASTHTVYSMQVMGSYVYVSWITGF